MSDFEIAVQRLTAWIRDYGCGKSREFQGDLSIVLVAAQDSVRQQDEIERLRAYEACTGQADCTCYAHRCDALDNCRRLLREAVLRDGLVDERWFKEAREAAGGECDHHWETVDHSYDHAYGCEKIVMDVCSVCGAERPNNTQRLGDDVI
jgi:hypothetical protein